MGEHEGDADEGSHGEGEVVVTAADTEGRLRGKLGGTGENTGNGSPLYRASRKGPMGARSPGWGLGRGEVNNLHQFLERSDSGNLSPVFQQAAAHWV